MELYEILICIAVAVATMAIGFFVGVTYRKRIAEAKIGSAEQHANRIVEEAAKAGEQKKKEALIEAKEEILRNKNDAERELKDRRLEVHKLEKRIVAKEENLDRKLDNLEKKDELINKRIKDIQDKEAEVEEIKAKQLKVLEEYSGLTGEQAKAYLVEKYESEARHDAAVKLVEIEQELKDTADEKAKNLITLSIQRCAASQVTESTVSVVVLPNDDMKGRIIGREGRNIRTIETLTGVDLIIDDTPEAITLSSFDPMRREIAKLSIEKLISDGRIHPARIEEAVDKSRKEVEAIIKQAGEQAVLSAGIHSMNSEMIKLLGKLKYRTSYGQNVLTHSLEVSYIAGMLADELGVDSMLARRAGLLHDIGKALNHEVEGSHTQLGVEIAKKYRENKDVIHAIEAHHNDVEPQTIIAVLVQAADAISAARPGARREDLESYIKRLEKLEEIANSYEGVEKSFAIQAGRELRLMVKPEVVNDENMVFIARDIVKKIENELEYPGQIKVHVIRESRAIEYAK
ncbi:MAG: ribonuclease Y [Oscillospiraceae bacterium]|nr:ribonuclease Y [Oscillospiraceae bacterium]